VFHTLVADPHVYRYLMDGQVTPQTWCAERIAGSEALFLTRGVGLWLARDRESGETMSFCGFLEIPGSIAEPQLVYALAERHAGRGLATEMAKACVAAARAAGFTDICARRPTSADARQRTFRCRSNQAAASAK
jgi:RimJ/RimL family protein N-acetyltransferase